MLKDRTVRTCSALVAALVLTGTMIAARPASESEHADPDPDRVVQELEGIRGELRSIGKLLGAFEVHQRATMLMTRIQLKQQRLSSVEGLVRSSRTELEAVEQEIERLAEMERMMLQRLGVDSADERTNEGVRRELEVMGQQKKLLESRAEALRMRVVEQENDLTRALKDIHVLEEAVDEQLGLR